MNMEDFHCDMFNMSFDFASGDFDKSAFAKEAGIKDETEYRDEDGDLVFSLSLPSKKDIKKQHGHLTVLIRPDMSGRIGLDFHRPGAKEIKKAPPYMEDATKWLSKFFSKKQFPTMSSINYEFDKTFETTIPLPFPLVVSSEKLSGLKVTGLSLEYPKESDVITAIVQEHQTGRPWIFLQQVTLLNVDTFDVYKELRKLQSTVTSLVRKRDGNHEVKTRKAQKTRARTSD